MQYRRQDHHRTPTGGIILHIHHGTNEVQHEQKQSHSPSDVHQLYSAECFSGSGRPFMGHALLVAPVFMGKSDTRSDKSGDMSDNAEDRDKSCILTEHKILLARVAFKTIVLGMLGGSCGVRLACGAFSFDCSRQYRSASTALDLLRFFRFCLYGGVCVDSRL